MTGPGRSAWFAAALGVVVLSGLIGHAAPQRGLTAPDVIARAINLAYDADFAAAEAEAARACGPAPRPACEVAKAVIQWWRIFLDVENRSRDAAFTRQVEWAVSQTEAWTKQEPDRAEAWVYLGAAYGARSQFHVWRREFFPVIRDGKRIKVSLERALSLDAELHDAHFGIGLYRYYADMAPTILKFLRWLFALPGGNKVAGMQQMLRTQDRGILMRTEAAYQIYQINIWYEHRIDHALQLLQELRGRHPHNPLFLLNLAQLHETYRNDRPAALAAYTALVDGARAGTLHEPALAEVWGRRGVAVQWDVLGESDRAIDQLRALLATRPAAPFGYGAQLQLDLGRALDRMGRRQEAVAAYRAGLAVSGPPDDPEGIRKRLDAGLAQAPPAAAAEGWRLSVEGWRAYERHAYAEAATRLERAVQLAPGDGIAWYRRGMVAAAQGDTARAAAAFDRAALVRPSAPPPVVARALLERGNLAQAAGDLAGAAAAFDAGLRVSGADPATVEMLRRERRRLETR